MKTFPPKPIYTSFPHFLDLLESFGTVFEGFQISSKFGKGVPLATFCDCFAHVLHKRQPAAKQRQSSGNPSQRLSRPAEVDEMTSDKNVRKPSQTTSQHP